MQNAQAVLSEIVGFAVILPAFRNDSDIFGIRIDLMSRIRPLVFPLVPLLVVIALAYCCMIYWMSTIVEGVRYFVLRDDAMISMRYAYNLAHGQGLVWNAGDRVEGFTNLGWTLVA